MRAWFERRAGALPDELPSIAGWLPLAVAICAAPGAAAVPLVVGQLGYLRTNVLPTIDRALAGGVVIGVGLLVSLVYHRALRRRAAGETTAAVVRRVNLLLSPLLLLPPIVWLVAPDGGVERPLFEMALVAAMAAWSGALACRVPARAGALPAALPALAAASFAALFVAAAVVQVVRYGAGTLLVLQAGWLALGAAPLWLHAREASGRPWSATAVVIAYLVHPGLRGAGLSGFQPLTLAVPLVITAAWLLRSGRMLACALATAVLLLAHPDVSLRAGLLTLLVNPAFALAGVLSASGALHLAILLVPLAAFPLLAPRAGWLLAFVLVAGLMAGGADPLSPRGALGIALLSCAVALTPVGLAHLRARLAARWGLDGERLVRAASLALLVAAVLGSVVTGAILPDLPAPAATRPVSSGARSPR